VDVFFEKNKNPLSLSYSHDYENETQIWRFYCLLYILVSAYSYGVGVLEQKKTLLCVITCFLTGVYPVTFSYLFFSVPAIFVGAPPSLAGLFSIFTSAALELLYGGTWTVTQWFLYLCFIVCVLWDAYETIHPAEEEHKQEEHESSKGFTRKDDSESISLFQSWDERFHKAVMLKERSKDQRKTPY